MKYVLKKLQFKLQQKKETLEAALLEVNKRIARMEGSPSDETLKEQAQLIEALLIIDVAFERISNYED